MKETETQRSLAAVGRGSRPRHRRNPLVPYGLAFAVVCLCVALGLPFRGVLDPHNLTMVFLTGVVFIAIWLGTGPSLFASVVVLLAFNFFFVEPFYVLSVFNPGYYFTFAILLAASLGVSLMTGRLRRQAEIAARQKRQMTTLFDVTRDLASTRTLADILTVLETRVGHVFAVEICIWLQRDGALQPFPVRPAESQEFTIVEWVMEKAGSGGQKPSPIVSGEGLYCPMLAEGVISGVLSFHPQGPAGQLTSEDMQQFEAFSGLAAVALQRLQQAEFAVKARAETENERLRNMLLSSLSHDLRTPLTVMNGGLSALLRMRKRLPREALDEVTLLWSQLTGLQKFVSNLLKMAAISSGQLKLKRELYLIQEIMGAAVSRLDETRGNRTISTVVTGQLTMVIMDGSLMEQVLINLLDNAIAHTASDGNILLSARRDADWLVVSVSDDGPGLAPGVENRVFERFEGSSGRRKDTKGAESTGLGLAICKAIIEAHGGSIKAFNNSTRDSAARGATFSFTLPLQQGPA